MLPRSHNRWQHSSERQPHLRIICVRACDICLCFRMIWTFPLKPHFDVSSCYTACCPNFFRFKHLFLRSHCINCLSVHFLLFAAIALLSQLPSPHSRLLHRYLLQFSPLLFGSPFPLVDRNHHLRRSFCSLRRLSAALCGSNS